MKFFIMSFNKPFPGELGVCLPAACDDSDFYDDATFGSIKSFLNMSSSAVGSIASELVLEDASTGGKRNPFNVQDDRLAWGDGTSAAIAVATLLVALVVFSSITVSAALRRQRVVAAQRANAFLDVAPAGAEGQEQQTPPESTQLSKRLKICEAFTVTGPAGSWRALFKIEKARPTDCLNGFRVLSMFFIVLGHGLLEPMNIAGYSNAECIDKSRFCLNAASTNMWTYLLLAGQLGVDTFFFIGGFLLSYVGKSRSAPILMGTALRYLRLFPLFGFIQMLYILVSPYLAFGPFSPRFQEEVFSACGTNSWWSELLFIQAFYPWFPDQGGCMGWSWYLGVDMFLAIFGLVLLNIWKKMPRTAWAIAFVTFVTCCAVTIQQSLYHKIQYNVLDRPSFAIYGKYLYSRPYARIPGFLVGLVAPWALVAMEKRGLRRGTQPQSWLAHTLVITASLIALVVALVCIFLPFSNANGPGPYATARKALSWTLWENALWIGLSRPAWCLCWLTWAFGCYFDYLPYTNAIFSHWLLAPFATLTFGAYLVHPIIYKIIAGNMDSYMIYSAFGAVERAVFVFFIAYAVSVATWCLVEKPFATMSGWLVPKRKSAPKPRQDTAESSQA